MMLAIFIFMGAALAVAAFLVISSMRTSREEQRELILAREREHTARQDAEKARATRARWEAKIAADQLVAAESDPRGKGDGLGRETARHLATRRFGRDDAPAPFISSTKGLRHRRREIPVVREGIDAHVRHAEVHEKGLADDDLHREVRADLDGDGTPDRTGRFEREQATDREPHTHERR